MDPEDDDDGPPVDPRIASRLVKDSDFGPLRKILTAMWAAGIAASYARVGAQLGETVAPKPDGPAQKRIMRQAAQQITAIEATTRARVEAYVNRAAADGLTPRALAKMIAADPSGAFGKARASMIARTESAMVSAHGSVAGWRDSGRVDKVIIYDGVDDPDCAAANGSIWTLEEYEANPLQHPNCTRAAAPWIDLD